MRGRTIGSSGAMTADGQPQLSFRYRYALFDEAAAARFVAAYAATLDELATSSPRAPAPASKPASEPVSKPTSKPASKLASKPT